MNALQSIKLSDALTLVAKPTYILGTTYTLSLAFFESVLFPHFDRQRLRSCLILCDEIGYRNALSEAGALQGAAQDYIVQPAPVGSFHAKVWLIVSDTGLLLLTGSGNLTQSGFMSNAELFDGVHFTAGKLPSKRLLDQLADFVVGLMGMWAPQDREHILGVEPLKEIERLIRRFPTSSERDADAPQFLHSFRGRILDQLPSMADARALYVAAPYFGASIEGLHQFATLAPKAKLHIFPAVHGGTATDVPLKQIAAKWKGARVAQLKIQPKKKAFAHLKLYGAAIGAKAGWIFCTSANCTVAGLLGPNIEAGLLRPVSTALLEDYFVGTSESFPQGKLPPHDDDSEAKVIRCWASDTGSGVDVLIANESKTHLPLRDVEIVVRAGSTRHSYRRSSLFSDGGFVHLPWTHLKAGSADGRLQCRSSFEVLSRTEPKSAPIAS